MTPDERRRIRAEALEEAARVADDKIIRDGFIAAKWQDGHRIAAAIRARKEEPK